MCARGNPSLGTCDLGDTRHMTQCVSLARRVDGVATPTAPHAIRSRVTDAPPPLGSLYVSTPRTGYAPGSMDLLPRDIVRVCATALASFGPVRQLNGVSHALQTSLQDPPPSEPNAVLQRIESAALQEFVERLDSAVATAHLQALPANFRRFNALRQLEAFTLTVEIEIDGVGVPPQHIRLSELVSSSMCMHISWPQTRAQAKSPPRMTRTTSSYLLATPGTRFDRLWRASKWDGWCLNLQQWIQMPMTQTTATKSSHRRSCSSSSTFALACSRG